MTTPAAAGVTLKEAMEGSLTGPVVPDESPPHDRTARQPTGSSAHAMWDHAKRDDKQGFTRKVRSVFLNRFWSGPSWFLRCSRVRFVLGRSA
jgi:hypothetical protein